MAVSENYIAELNNIKEWRKEHIEEHKILDDKIDKLQNRLPYMATFYYSILTFIIGVLVTALAVALK